MVSSSTRLVAAVVVAVSLLALPATSTKLRFRSKAKATSKSPLAKVRQANKHLTNLNEVFQLIDTGSPHTDIMAAISAIETRIVGEQTAAQSAHNSYMATTAAELADLNNQLSQAQARNESLRATIAGLEADLARLASELSALEQQLSTAQANKATTEQMLVDQQAARDAAAALYDQNVAEHEAAIAHLQEALDMIADSTLDLAKAKAKLNKAAAALSSSKHAALIKMAAAMANKMATHAQTKEARAADVQHLIDLIQSLIDGLQQSLDLYHQEETAAVNLWENTTRPDLENLIAQYGAEISGLNAAIAQNHADANAAAGQLAQKQADLATTENLIRALEQQIADLEEERGEASFAFAADSSRRAAELDVLHQLRAHISELTADTDEQYTCHQDSPDCARCLNDAHCDDGIFCNGVETCGSDGWCNTAAAQACDEATELCDEAGAVCDQKPPTGQGCADTEYCYPRYDNDCVGESYNQMWARGMCPTSCNSCECVDHHYNCEIAIQGNSNFCGEIIADWGSVSQLCQAQCGCAQ